jgi:hypothetical protein
VFEGIPYQIQMDSGVSLEYYVDLTEKPIFRDYEIEVKIKRRKAHDNFFENAEGLSFELMASKGVNFPIFDIPYLLIKDNAVEAGLSLAISLFVMTKELIIGLDQLAKAIDNVIEATTPSVGVGVVTPLGEIITLVTKALALVAYVALLIVALLKLGQQLFELIFPKVRYFQGCKVKDLIEKGCQYLGYTLDSNLLNNLSNLTILPVPLVKEKDSFWDFLENDLNFAYTKGYPTAQDSTPTLGSLIDAVELTYNAKTRVRNGVVQIERRDFWQNVTSNQIVPALNLQDRRQNEYTLNTEEIWKRTYIHYRVDYSDTHTLDFYDPTDAEYSTEPLNVVNADLVSIKGLNEVAIPFALGVRKNSLNWLEKTAKAVFEVIDSVSGFFGSGTNFASIIENRIGVTQISQQFFSTSKLLWTVNKKQPENYVDIMRASNIYEEYHQINEITVNDYQIFSDVPVRIRPQDFVNLLNNNFADIDGVLCEILTIQFVDEQSEAIIAYKKPFDYADGKVEIITINE